MGIVDESMKKSLEDLQLSFDLTKARAYEFGSERDFRLKHMRPEIQEGDGDPEIPLETDYMLHQL